MKSYNQMKEGESVALPSAADLFIFYKKCLVQCASLSTGAPLLQLSSMFQQYLKDYAHKILIAYTPKYAGNIPLTTLPPSLSPSLPPRPSLSSGTSVPRLTLTGLKRDTPSDIRLTQDELILTCTLLCTADYCMETTQQV